MKSKVFTNPNGDKFWFKTDTCKLHRDGGPAVEFTDGEKYWYKDGVRHREDGPAVEFANGSKMWFLKGQEYTEEEFNNKIKNGF